MLKALVVLTLAMTNLSNQAQTIETLNKILAAETQNKYVISDDNLTLNQLTKIKLCRNPELRLEINKRILWLKNCNDLKIPIRIYESYISFIATRTIEKNETITHSNTTEIFIKKNEDNLASIRNNVVAAERILAGRTIKTKNTKEKNDIQAGEKIKAVYKINGIELTKYLTPKHNARIGDKVSVEESNAVFTAVKDNELVILKIGQ